MVGFSFRAFVRPAEKAFADLGGCFDLAETEIRIQSEQRAPQETVR
jgi:hypothetical protein